MNSIYRNKNAIAGFSHYDHQYYNSACNCLTDAVNDQCYRYLIHIIIL